LAGFDLVAGGEHGLLNLRAIQLGAVGASLVDDTAAVGTAFDREVNAGHVIVVWNGELSSVGSAADANGLSGRERDFFSGKWTYFNFEDCGHR